MPDEKDKPPYLAYPTYKGFITGLGDSPTMPAVIDKTVMSKLPFGVQSQMIPALRFFGQIEGKSNKPTAALEAAVQAVRNADAWREHIKTDLYPKYGALTSAIDITNTTNDELTKAIEAVYDMGGSTRDKAFRFFVAMAIDSQTALSPFIKPPKASGRAPGERRRMKVSSNAAVERPIETAEPPAREHQAPDGMIEYLVHFKAKPSARIIIPKNLTVNEMKLVESQIQTIRLYAEMEGGDELK